MDFLEIDNQVGCNTGVIHNGELVYCFVTNSYLFGESKVYLTQSGTFVRFEITFDLQEWSRAVRNNYIIYDNDLDLQISVLIGKIEDEIDTFFWHDAQGYFNSLFHFILISYCEKANHERSYQHIDEDGVATYYDVASVEDLQFFIDFASICKFFSETERFKGYENRSKSDKEAFTHVSRKLLKSVDIPTYYELLEQWGYYVCQHGVWQSEMIMKLLSESELVDSTITTEDWRWDEAKLKRRFERCINSFKYYSR